MSIENNNISPSDQEMANAGIIQLESPGKPNILKKPENIDDVDDVDEKPDDNLKPIPTPHTPASNEKPDDVSDEKKPEINFDDIPDEKLLEIFNKKNKTDFKSLSEITKPPASNKQPLSQEELEAIAKQKSENAMKFGMDKKLFTKDEYDSFIRFNSEDPLNIVLKSFSDEMKAEHPEMDDKEIEENFKEFYHLYEDNDSLKYKRGMKRINEEYQQIKNNLYPNLVNIENIYDGVMTNTERAKGYKSRVDELFTKVPATRSFNIENNEIIVDLFKPEELADIKPNYLTEEMMNAVYPEDGNLDETTIQEEIQKDFVFKNLDTIVASAAKKLADIMVSKVKKGRKAANFTEDSSGEHEIPGVVKTKSPSDREMEESGILN